MKLTGKCREGFEKWLIQNYKNLSFYHGKDLAMFNDLPHQMCNALIIDYFSTFKYKGQDFWLYVFDAYYKIKIESMTINDVNIKAIEKANEILNKELTINLLTKNKLKMKEFKGTRGEVEILINNEIGLLITAMNGNKSICSVWNSDTLEEEALANAKLIIDAFKVRQSINCELSELLEQRNEMLAMLEKVRKHYRSRELEQLIKKVKDNE
jgi:hypothetical protein